MSSVSPRSAIDAWVCRELKRSYGAVLAEPIPPELLRILQEAPAPLR